MLATDLRSPPWQPYSKIADRFGDGELRTIARLLEGRCVIYFGDLTEGLAMLDEAMVAVEAEEVSPVVAGDAYCIVIDACAELFDVHRCGAGVQPSPSGRLRSPPRAGPALAAGAGAG